MVNCTYETLLPRFTPTCAACHRCRAKPEDSRPNVPHLSRDYQTLPQSPTRARTCLAQSNSWSARGERNRVADPSPSTTGSSSRRDTGRALSSVRGYPWYPGQSGEPQSRSDGLGLDAKKKEFESQRTG